MLNHAIEARALVAGRSRADLDTDRAFALQLVRLMEIFGEASRRIDGEFREEHPEFAWQDAVDFRNVLIHQFDRIDYDIVWGIVSGELPDLINQLEMILENEV